jgi:hypothetical protein
LAKNKTAERFALANDGISNRPTTQAKDAQQDDTASIPDADPSELLGRSRLRTQIAEGAVDRLRHVRTEPAVASLRPDDTGQVLDDG